MVNQPVNLVIPVGGPSVFTALCERSRRGEHEEDAPNASHAARKIMDQNRIDEKFHTMCNGSINV